MTLQRAAQSRSSIPEANLRSSRLREGIDEFGLCICGTHVAWHFDADDRYLPCDHCDVVLARFAFGHGASNDHFNEDDANLAWLIFAKVEH